MQKERPAERLESFQHGRHSNRALRSVGFHSVSGAGRQRDQCLGRRPELGDGRYRLRYGTSSRTGTAPLSINFINSSTGSITAYAWTFGDGTTSTSQNPVHVYPVAGTYTVSLEVTGPGGTNTKTLQTIDKIVVYSLQDNHNSDVEPSSTLAFSLYGLTDFAVQGYNGSAWVMLATVANNRLVKRTVKFVKLPAPGS